MSVNQKNAAMVDLNNRLLDEIRELEKKVKKKQKKEKATRNLFEDCTLAKLSKNLKKKVTLKKRKVKMDEEERDLAGANPQAIANLTPNEESNMLVEINNGENTSSSIGSADVMWGAGQPNIIVGQPMNWDVPSSSSQSTNYFEGVEDNSVSDFHF